VSAVWEGTVHPLSGLRFPTFQYRHVTARLQWDVSPDFVTGTGRPGGGFVDDILDDIATWIAAAQRVVALTGAGISTGSGIPDFRGPQGVWTRDPAAERKATIQAWMDDPDLRRDAWRFRVDNRDVRYQPNEAHVALADLERLGRLDLLVTQNVDGLHHDAGHSHDRVVEVHGTVREAACLDCQQRWPMTAVLDRVAAGDPDPHCPDCGGLIKSATISFGQALVEEDMLRAQVAAERADVLLALGTSLAVYPVAFLPMHTKRKGGRVVIVNAESTEQDDLADAVIQADLVEVLPRLVAMVQERLPG
jgi:NAD-dependent deacetylase